MVETTETWRVIRDHLESKNLGAYLSWVPTQLDARHSGLVAQVLRQKPAFELIWTPCNGVALSQAEVMELMNVREWNKEVSEQFRRAADALRSVVAQQQQGGRSRYEVVVEKAGAARVLANRILMGTPFAVLNTLPDEIVRKGSTVSHTKGGKWTLVRTPGSPSSEHFPDVVQLWLKPSKPSAPPLGDYELKERRKTKQGRSSTTKTLVSLEHRSSGQIVEVTVEVPKGDRETSFQIDAASANGEYVALRGEGPLRFSRDEHRFLDVGSGGELTFGRVHGWQAATKGHFGAESPEGLSRMLFGRRGGMVLRGGDGGVSAADEELALMREDIRNQIIEGLKTAVKIDRKTQSIFYAGMGKIKDAVRHMVQESTAVSKMLPDEVQYCATLAELLQQVDQSNLELDVETPQPFLEWVRRLRDEKKVLTNVRASEREMSGRYVYRVLKFLRDDADEA